MKPAARRKRSPMSRLRPYWIVGIIVAGLAVIAVAAIANEPMFHLKTLAVTGLSRVSRNDVVARAAIDPSANVWLLNKRAIEARIETIPYVRTATIHRRPLADVSVAIDERVATNCVRDAVGRVVTIDVENRVLQNDCTDGSLVAYAIRTPIEQRAGDYLHDAELIKLESDAHTLGTTDRRFRAYTYDRFGQLVAFTSDGVAIEFGDEDDLDRKERLIGPIYAQVGSRAGLIKAVDLRAPATPVVEFKTPIHTIYTRKTSANHNI